VVYKYDALVDTVLNHHHYHSPSVGLQTLDHTSLHTYLFGDDLETHNDQVDHSHQDGNAGIGIPDERHNDRHGKIVDGHQ